MKVLVVGAGVIGTVYGEHLAAAGNSVLLSEPRPAHLMTDVPFNEFSGRVTLVRSDVTIAQRGMLRRGGSNE